MQLHAWVAIIKNIPYNAIQHEAIWNNISKKKNSEMT
jgi:hypothetical protein